MSALESLETIASAKDFRLVCEAIETVTGEIRAHTLDEDALVQISDVLLRTAEHSKWEVRHAVAHALRYVRHGTVDATLLRLSKDDATRVRKAAEESIARRSERTQLDLLPYLQDERLEKMLAKLESDAARQTALQVGAAYTEFMVRGLYHEAVRVLMSVNTSLMVLERQIKSPYPMQEEAIARAEDFRERLRHLQGILDGARVYVSEAAPEYQEVLLAEVIERAYSSLYTHEIFKTSALGPHIDVEPGLTVSADPTLLRQVLENVLKNALEASAGRRLIRIRIQARRVKQYVQITIRDFGCGMTREAVQDLFRPYRSRKKGGT